MAFLQNLLTRQPLRDESASLAIFPDDCFLVSYPKSGNTWVRFLLANLICPPGAEIDFRTVHQFVPEAGRQNDIAQAMTRPRILKSHATFQKDFPRVVYLLRDGRDAYVSYYHYRLLALSAGTTFAEFLGPLIRSNNRWSRHVNSWLEQSHSGQQVLLVRYEGLLSDPLAELKRIVSFVGLERNLEQMEAAIQRSSFETMRRLEEERGRLFEKVEGGALFTRKGVAGGWVDFFGAREKELCKAFDGETLLKFGYVSSHDW